MEEQYIYSSLRNSSQGYKYEFNYSKKNNNNVQRGYAINAKSQNNNQQHRQPKVFTAQAFDTQQISHKEKQVIEEMILQDPYQDSFLVYDPSRIGEITKTWNSTIPWIGIRYAVKCNPLKCLLQDIDKLGCGFDVASQGELQRLVDIGVDPERIIYSNPFKCEKDLIYAYNYGLRLTVADTMGELEKIQALAPKMKILWRISVQEQNQKKGTISFAEKFGDPMNSIHEIQEKFQTLYKKGYKISGIHFHAGSNHTGSDNFQEWLTVARQCMIAAKQIGHPMEILDIGGGFAANYINESFTQVLQYTEKDPIGCQLIAEPGRHIASRLFKLACRVIGKRVDADNNRVCLYVNDGIYHAFNKVSTDGVTLNGSKLFMEDRGQNNDSKFLDFEDRSEVKATIYGQTCDGLDVIASDITIPRNIEIGDWFVFGGMGAYTFSLVSNFNSMESCKNILVINDHEILVPQQDMNSNQNITNSNKNTDSLNQSFEDLNINEPSFQGNTFEADSIPKKNKKNRKQSSNRNYLVKEATAMQVESILTDDSSLLPQILNQDIV